MFILGKVHSSSTDFNDNEGFEGYISGFGFSTYALDAA